MQDQPHQAYKPLLKSVSWMLQSHESFLYSLHCYTLHDCHLMCIKFYHSPIQQWTVHVILDFALLIMKP